MVQAHISKCIAIFRIFGQSLVRGGQEMHSKYIYEAEDEVSTIESLFLFLWHSITVNTDFKGIARCFYEGFMPPRPDLIFVTNITNIISGEKLSYGEISPFHV